MSRRYPTLVVSDLLAAIDELALFTEGFTYESFIQDMKTLRAAMATVLILGEGSNLLSEDIKALCPDIPWDKIRGTRNRLIHEYFDVDSRILWQIATVEAPLLKQPLMDLLNQLQNGSSL